MNGKKSKKCDHEEKARVIIHDGSKGGISATKCPACGLVWWVNLDGGIQKYNELGGVVFRGYGGM